LCAITTATWPLTQTVQKQMANTEIQSAQEIIFNRGNKESRQKITAQIT